MINIDKLVIAFKLRLEHYNKVVFQFDNIEKEIERINKLNQRWDDEFKSGRLDFVTAINDIPILPYQFGKTELREVELKEIKTHFKNNYWVYVNGIQIGVLQWETYGNSRNYGYLSIINRALYCEDWKLYKQAINNLNLIVSHISKLDLAYDSTLNPTKRYLDIIKDKNNEIIINGVLIKNRDNLLESPYFTVKGTLDDPFKCPKIYFCTVDKSTIVRTYNKTEEIETHSHKNYINEKYGHTEKDIYRCEVSLNTHSVNRLIDDIIRRNNLDSEEEGLNLFLKQIEDKDSLLKLHKVSMFRLFRYSHKGKKRKTILSYYKR